jgi:hypothetical protein
MNINGLAVGISIVFEIFSQFPIYGNLKFTIVLKIHIKFEKNWRSGYQEIKNRFKNRKGRVALKHLSMMVKVIN